MTNDRPEKKKLGPTAEARLKHLGLDDASPAQPPGEPPESKTTKLIAEIESWEWDYSLSAVRNPHSRDDWKRQEFRHLVLKGNLIRPSRFKLRAVQLTIVPTEPEVDETRSSESIGYLGRSRSLWKPLVSIPASGLVPILTIADRLKFFIIEAFGDPRLSPDIRSFSLRMAVDDEELQE
ncbi:hypothetical protein [Mesorhizobium sp. NPDC059025]|uniref:hypothetical protein n=1 Tax=unclassified Mesorhizobium TaxID=325217 RepID=UPI0036C79386